jgi:spermidine synthase
MADKSTYQLSRPVVLLLFFFSGASALVYEVVWGRMLVLVFGGTSFAISTVLAAFMGGLALGSYLFGKLIDKRGHPLVVYGLLEAGIALWALLIPALLSLLNSGYGLLYREMDPSFYVLSLLRFSLTFLVILVPTTLMGGTLPVLMRLLTATGALVGRTSALLYFANTSGAVIGTFTAGFMLIPALGLRGTTYLAVVVNIAVALLAVLMARKIDFKSIVPAFDDKAAEYGGGLALKRRLDRGMVLFVYAFSGFTALAYEVVWTRVLVSIVGTTTYAFTTMLTTFLLGLAIGSLLFSRLADRIGSVRPLAAIQFFIALLAIATIPMLGALPGLFIKLQGPMGSGWWGQVGLRFALCMLAMLPPTLLLGGTFPVVAKLYAGNAKGIGANIGRMYAFNTIGAILGSFLAGFVAIPLIGQQSTILVAISLNILAALALVLFIRGPIAGRAVIGAACAAALLLTALVPKFELWDKKMMSSGVYLYGSEYATVSELEEVMANARLLYFKEDKDATVSVWQEGSVKYMRINGKTEASTGSDMLTQRMVGTLPMLFHPEPRHGLLIGLASGVTAGSMLCHPMDKLECVEIVSGMDEAAAVFSRENYDCLNDPRFELIESDGRNHILLTDATYDVIVSQGSNPWVAGCVNLFTIEFFELAKRHLKPGGIVGQWVQIYSMTREDFDLVLSTFHNVFPHVTVWQASEGDIVLLGSESELPTSYEYILEAMSRPRVAEDLASVGMDTFPGLFSCFLLDSEALESYLAGFSRHVTDNDPSLEFTMPRTIGRTTHNTRIREVGEHRRPPDSYVTGAVPDAVRADLKSAYSARGEVFAAVEAAAQGRSMEALEILRGALALNPRDALGMENLSRFLLEYASMLVQNGDLERAAPAFEEVWRLGHPLHSPKAASNLGMCRYLRGDLDYAVKLWREVSPTVSEANYNLAGYYLSVGHTDSAEASYRKALELDPNDSDSMNELAWTLAVGDRDLEYALGLALRATELDPSGANLDTLGWVHYKLGDYDSAAAVLEDCIDRWGESSEYLYHLGMAYAKGGRRDEALRTLRNSAEMANDEESRSRATRAMRELQ